MSKQKLLLVKHPTTGKTYAIFADAEIGSNDQEDIVLLGVKRVAEIIQIGNGLPPLPIPLNEVEGVRIVNECIEQVAALAKGFLE